MSYPIVALNDICDLLNGYAFKSSDYVENSNTLSCRMSNIRPGGIFDIDYNKRFLPDSFVEQYKQFLLNDGDVIIAMTDLADAPKILGVPTVVKSSGRNVLLNQRVGKLVIKNHERVHFPFLQIALNNPKVRAIYKKFAGGGLQINLGKKDLLSVKIPLPPLAEQQQIAAILDEADSLRQKDQQLVEHYTQLSQSLFLEMFGDPVTNPMGWEQKTLESLTTQITDGTHHTPTYTNTGVPFLRVTDVTGSNETKKFISQEEHQELIKRCKPEKNDILYTKNGTIGVGKIVDWNYDFSIFVSLCLLKPKHEDVEVKYLNHFLNTPFALRQAMRHSKEATIKNLHLVEIKKMKIPYPDLEEQKDFVNKLQVIEKQKKQAQANLHKSNDLFNALLQKAFTGELTSKKAA